MRKYFMFSFALAAALGIAALLQPAPTADANVARGTTYFGTLNVASLADGVGATHTIVVPPARLGDHCTASMGVDLAGILLTCYVSATAVVSVRFQNETAGVIDLASTTLRVFFWKTNPIPTASAVT